MDMDAMKMHGSYRHCWKQEDDNCRIFLFCEDIRVWSQGNPKMMAWLAVQVTNKAMLLTWRAPTWMFSGRVWVVTNPSLMQHPSMAWSLMGHWSSSVGRLSFWTISRLMKLLFTPESMSAERTLVESGSFSSTWILTEWVEVGSWLTRLVELDSSWWIHPDCTRNWPKLIKTTSSADSQDKNNWVLLRNVYEHFSVTACSCLKK